MIANDLQVQQFVNERVRPHAELVRALVIALESDRASIDSVYAALTQASPTWADNRTDGPPNMLTKDDVLAFNTFAEDVKNYIKAHAQYSVVLKACVRPPQL